MVDVIDTVKERLRNIPGYQEGMPAHRMDGVSTFDELELTWGRKWGAQSCMGKLRFAWIHRVSESGPSEEYLADPVFFSGIKPWPGEPKSDPAIVAKQLDELTAAVESEGVEVIRSEPARDDQHGAYVSRIPSVNLEPYIVKGGALIANKAMASQRGHERWSSEFLSSIGCPILWQPIGTAIHETRGNMMFLDPKHCIQGVGLRTNMEGIQQVEPILRAVGVEEIHIAQTPGYLYSNHRCIAALGPHLVNCLNMVDEKLAVCVPGALPYDTLRYVMSKGIRLIEVPEEEALNRAGGVLTIEPGVVIMALGNPITTAALRKEGVRVVEVDMTVRASQYLASPLCMTGPLVRDDGPFLDD
jgi:N-dimethylarginine dimethylaminohydrolase